MGQFLWRIDTGEAVTGDETAVEIQPLRSRMPEDTFQYLKSALAFTYAHSAATHASSKQTATGRKGRVKDEEAAEDTQMPSHSYRPWRSPSFVEARKDGITYGSAMHQCMQFICYENCADEQGVREEITRMVEQGFLTREQGNMVNGEDIAAFFDSDLGRKLRAGAEHLREFKFSILDDAMHYENPAHGEQVLLQGVVDCAIVEADGITIIDFKTDKVTESNVDAVAEGYKLQVRTYGEALSRIYEKPIKAMKLWFFRLKRFVDV